MISSRKEIITFLQTLNNPPKINKSNENVFVQEVSDFILKNHHNRSLIDKLFIESFKLVRSSKFIDFITKTIISWSTCAFIENNFLANILESYISNINQNSKKYFIYNMFNKIRKYEDNFFYKNLDTIHLFFKFIKNNIGESSLIMLLCRISYGTSTIRSLSNKMALSSNYLYECIFSNDFDLIYFIKNNKFQDYVDFLFKNYKKDDIIRHFHIYPISFLKKKNIDLIKCLKKHLLDRELLIVVYNIFSYNFSFNKENVKYFLSILNWLDLDERIILGNIKDSTFNNILLQVSEPCRKYAMFC